MNEDSFEVKFQIESSEINEEVIKDCLNLNLNDFEEAFSKLAKAAFIEYINMLKDKGLPTKASEIMQERIYLLSIHYFKEQIPSENEISSIFQIPLAQSKTLLNNIKSRYRVKIKHLIKNSLRKVIDQAIQNPNEDYILECNSPSIIQDLNLIIDQKGIGLKPIEKIKNSASKYVCTIDTYNLLKSEI